MNNKTKIKLGSVFVATALSASMPAHAFLLCNDFPALAEEMYGHVQQAMAWAQQKALHAVDMDTKSLMNQMNMDQKDKLAAFNAFNKGRIAQDVQQKQIKEELAGNKKEACGAIATSKGLGDAMCATVNRQKVSLAKNVLKSVDRSVSLSGFKTAQTRSIGSLEKECLGSVVLNGKGSWSSIAGAMANSQCQRADLIAGTPGAVMSKKQVKNAQNAIDLIVNPMPMDGQNYSISPNSEYNKKQRLRGLRRSAVKSLAQKSLSEVLRYNEPTNGISPLGAMDAFNEERYADPKGCWAAKWSGKPKASCETGNYTEDVKMPSQVMKEQLLIQGFMSNLAVEQFKSDLRTEALEATQLALQADPL